MVYAQNDKDEKKIEGMLKVYTGLGISGTPIADRGKLLTIIKYKRDACTSSSIP
jgi:hypothetical protein